MDHLTGTELVERALTNPLTFKKVAEALATRPPDEAAASALIRAYRNGASPPWMTALLLGRARHAAGYAVVLEILNGGHQLLSESYAGVALVGIDPVRARGDLLRVMMTAADMRVREGAAYGLRELNDPSLVDAFQEARQKELIRQKVFEHLAGRDSPGGT